MVVSVQLTSDVELMPLPPLPCWKLGDDFANCFRASKSLPWWGNKTCMALLVGTVGRNAFCILEIIKMHFLMYFYFMLVPNNVEWI